MVFSSLFVALTGKTLISLISDKEETPLCGASRLLTHVLMFRRYLWASLAACLLSDILFPYTMPQFLCWRNRVEDVPQTQNTNTDSSIHCCPIGIIHPTQAGKSELGEIGRERGKQHSPQPPRITFIVQTSITDEDISAAGMFWQTDKQSNLKDF